MNFEYIPVTESCGNEKKEILEKFSNSLFLDRVYFEDSLEERISSTKANKFLINRKCNGRERTKYIGRKVSQRPKYLHIDIDVKLRNVRIIRVVQHEKKTKAITTPILYPISGPIFQESELIRISCF